jgi:hypothetical protein
VIKPPAQNRRAHCEESLRQFSFRSGNGFINELFNAICLSLQFTSRNAFARQEVRSVPMYRMISERKPPGNLVFGVFLLPSIVFEINRFHRRVFLQIIFCVSIADDAR